MPACRACQTSCLRIVKRTTDPINPSTTVAFTPAIGLLIEHELKRQERTVSWFARKIHCDRRNIYDIFTRQSIDTELLYKISLALGVNFFAPISDALSSLPRVSTEECDAIPSAPTQLADQKQHTVINSEDYPT